LNRHGVDVSSTSLVLDEPLDWTAFGIWLSMLLNRHGNEVLRVKGILNVQGNAAPVFINAVQHIVHPPQHLERWPTEDRRSRIVFITRGIDPRGCGARWRRSVRAASPTSRRCDARVSFFQRQKTMTVLRAGLIQMGLKAAPRCRPSRSRQDARGPHSVDRRGRAEGRPGAVFQEVFTQPYFCPSRM
jgi:hypothetical protein